MDEDRSNNSSEEPSEDSEAGPSRWQQMQQDEEMDCVFIDEDQEEDELLPDFYDSDMV